MPKVFFRLLGTNRIAGAPKLSGSYLNISIIGSNKLDLREAAFPEDQPVCVKSYCLMGKTRIIVPHGTTVDLGGCKVIGNYEVNVSQAEEEVHNHLKVSHWCLIGDVKVISKVIDKE